MTAQRALPPAGAPARADELVIHLANEPSAIDVQFSRTGNDGMTSPRVFNRPVELAAAHPSHRLLPIVPLTAAKAD